MHPCISTSRTEGVKREVTLAMLLLLLCGCGDDEAPLPKVSNGYHRSIESERLASRRNKLLPNPAPRKPPKPLSGSDRARLEKVREDLNRARKIVEEAKANPNKSDEILIDALKKDPSSFALMANLRGLADGERLRGQGYVWDPKYNFFRSEKRQISPADQKRYLDHSIFLLQESLAAYRPDGPKHYSPELMVDLTMSAFAGGRNDLARKCAETVTADYSGSGNQWMMREVRQKCNMLLSMLAIKRNDLPEALTRLRKAGQLKGKAVYARFPAVPLLLSAGRRSEVIEYLRAVSSYLGDHGAGWIKTLKDGNIPNDEEWNARTSVDPLLR